VFPNGKKWLIPLLLTGGLVFVLSFRQLSDPDLGFHLKYGQWISLNHQAPDRDVSTYTVSGHRYTDLQWFFQWVLYRVYRTGGYPMISLFFCLLCCGLFLLFLIRSRQERMPLPVTTGWLLAAFLIIDPRIAPRPEIFTFLFLAILLWVLDSYLYRKRNRLFFLPLIMVVWCNTHALFVLGLVAMIVVFAGAWLQEKKPDRQLLIWVPVAILACLLNPYGAEGFRFPLELLTRFDPGNLFNQHISEFTPFFSQKEFELRDYLFLLMLIATIGLIFLHLDHTSPHEIALVILTGGLGLVSVRNIPLFVVAGLPVTIRLTTRLLRRFPSPGRIVNRLAFSLLVLVPAMLIPRVITNAYYLDSKSFNRTGLGVNPTQQPVGASRFLAANNLNGRIVNSLGFGGWLSWVLPQPVFIDGRLEVMQESLYQEIADSWQGGLPRLVERYQPSLIVYNHLRYYPWTIQLRSMKNWRLLYADGMAAVFARNDYRRDIPEISLPEQPGPSDSLRLVSALRWVDGFFRQPDFAAIDRQHLAMFRSGMMADPTRRRARFCFNMANDRYRNNDVAGARLYYDSAIILSPGYAKAYNNRGILRVEKMHDLSGALHDFTTAVEIDPGYADAWSGCGSVKFMMHDTTGACSDWLRARMLGSTQASRLLNRFCLPK